MGNTLFSTADWLRVENNRGLGPKPIPQPRDLEISDLLRTWTSLDEAARKEAAQGILKEQRFTLLGYSERMASLAVRERSEELIFLGLLALGIDRWRGDWRDNAALIALHYDVALRLNIEPGEVFERAAELLPPEPAGALRSFLQRQTATLTLKAMGYVIGADADGFRYERTW